MCKEGEKGKSATWPDLAALITPLQRPLPPESRPPSLTGEKPFSTSAVVDGDMGPKCHLLMSLLFCSFMQWNELAVHLQYYVL